ncbi:MAG: nitroreductase family protein [Pseudomonadota bacterium]
MKRTAQNPRVDEQFLSRWSPRAMQPDSPLSYEDLEPLFEAARWSPSSYNAQPWRFMYVSADEPMFGQYLDLLVEANRAWAQHAGALVLVISRSQFEHNDKDSITHSFDAGAAWMSFALQASMLGLVTHGMQGFDYDAARDVLDIPPVFQIEAMIAVGRPGDSALLPGSLRDRELPSDRKRLETIVMHGSFQQDG